MDFIQTLFEEKSPFKMIQVRKYERKAAQTFLPFASVKSIKNPKKWTIGHVWKAILAGQIQTVFCQQRLTDDYRFDAATNFGAGELDPFEFARDLIEERSGWWVSAKEDEKGKIALSVNLYHFNYNTMIFEE